MKIGVVIPSRLQPRPGGRTLTEYGPELWLDGALASVRQQSCFGFNWEIFVGISPDAVAPLHVYDFAHVIRADRPGQSAAVNVAAEVAVLSSDVLLFLEDDDRWHPDKTRIQLQYLMSSKKEKSEGRTSFVSCSQRLLAEDGSFVGTNDYPVPSSWMMTSNVWERVGGFARGCSWLVDMEWLGRLGQTKIARTHLVESGEVHTPNKLGFVSRFSNIVPCEERMLLVDRTVNTRGGMATIEKDPAARREADTEASEIRHRFGCDPW